MAADRPVVLLTDSFDEVKSGKKYRVTLTTAGIAWEPELSMECALVRVISLREVVAAVPCDCTVQQTKCYYCLQQRRPNRYRLSSSELSPLHVQSFRLCYAKREGRDRWRTKDVVFRSLGEGGVAREWIRAIGDALARLPDPRPQKLLVFVNPYGGKKAAPKLYREKVQPILFLAGCDVHMVETERANHARDYLLDVDLSKYDGVVCVGGDGMFSELLNGILLRTQSDAGVDVDDSLATLLKPKLALGVIPAGSTDAIAFGTTGVNDVITSTLQIVLGQRVGVDVCSLHSQGSLLRYATSFLSYGYFGDTLVESEKYRWMGPSRYDISGLKIFLGQKLYEGELFMEVVSCQEKPWLDDKCVLGCSVCSSAKKKGKEQNQDVQNNSRWVTLRGQFKAINVATISCRCGMSKEGISPVAHLGDGLTDIVVVGNCSPFGYLRYLFRTSMALSSPFELDFVKFYRVRQFRFTPHLTEELLPIAGDASLPPGPRKSTSIWNCDGEVISEPSIQAKVHCQLVSLFASGIEVRPPTKRSFGCFGCLP